MSAPDYRAADLCDEFTIAEAAAWWLGETLETNTVHRAPAAVAAFAREIGRRFGVADQRAYAASNRGYTQDRRTVTRAELLVLAEEKCARPAFLFKEERTKDEGSWPFSHDTKLLKAVRWTIQTYWEGKDPAECRTKDLVIEKLQTIHGLSQNEAEAVDLVTRHDSRRRSATKAPTKEHSPRKG